jgi:hypothetical protein
MGTESKPKSCRDNPFLNQLQKLQQDYAGAISTPARWLRDDDRPLLKVETKVDEDIEKVFQHLISEKSRDQAIWHFFAGSPGNGKSAAVGELVRKLNATGNFEFRVEKSGEDSTQIPLRELGDNPSSSHPYVPYKVYVYRKGENNCSLILAQDASIMPKVWAQTKPYQSFLLLLEEAMLAAQGANKFNCKSLIVCANHGILEEAKMKMEDKSLPWCDILAILESVIRDKSNGDISTLPLSKYERFGVRRGSPREILISHTILDKSSLFIDKSRRCSEQLLNNAVEHDSWKICEKCSSSNFCPFFTNRSILNSKDGRRGFLRTLRHSELLSNEIIVFREANALLSYILSGCPHDYGGTTPCEWVHGNVKTKNWLGLANRLIYAALFSSYKPNRLEYDPIARKEQRDLIEKFLKIVNKRRGFDPIKFLLDDKEAASTDVGVKRLLGVDGVLYELDPCNTPQDYKYIDRVSNSDLLETSDYGLERELGKLWADCGHAIESESNTSEIYMLFERLFTDLTIRREGFLGIERTPYFEEIERFLTLIESNKKQVFDQRRQYYHDLLLRVITLRREAGLPLNSYVNLDVQYLEKMLQFRIPFEQEENTLGIVVNIGELSSKNQIRVSTRSLILIDFMLSSGLTLFSAPLDELESVLDLLVKAAGNSKYHNKSDVKLYIDSHDLKTYYKVYRTDMSTTVTTH